MIGFNFPRRRFKWEDNTWNQEALIRTFKHCPIHAGVGVVPWNEGDPDKLYCKECGTEYLEQEAPNDERMKGKFKEQKTMIVTPRKKKKFYDEQGTEVTDPELIKQLQSGMRIVSYKEDKVEENHIIRKR